MLDVTDINNNDVSIRAYDGAPTVLRRTTNTLVIDLAQDEVLTLIEDLAKSAWAGKTHLVIEADRLTYPREIIA